jgi:CO dehydrogenase/acetyl-CoA synthase gamma subunit (corrinoid Fe-S protein)
VLLPRPSIFRLRSKSLLRGVLLSFGALVVGLRLEGFPDTGALHATPWQILAVPVACWGMVETARCLDRKWSLYHAGVLILLYAELMILALAIFLCLYPL